MSSERKPLSKRVRFEVFKRDGFTCQYCGNHPPAVILHVDHIHPVAEGGDNSQDNLLTSCEACNQGKGARLLTIVPDSFAAKSDLLREREEQLRGYQEIAQQVEDRLEGETWQVAEVFSPGCSDIGYSRSNLTSIRRFIEKLGVHFVVNAARLAMSQRMHADSRKFRYFCAVCWNEIKRHEEGG